MFHINKEQIRHNCGKHVFSHNLLRTAKITILICFNNKRNASMYEDMPDYRTGAIIKVKKSWLKNNCLIMI
jgi:hypothetical protein